MGKLARFLESPDEVLSDQSEAISNRLEKSIKGLVSQARNSQAAQNDILSEQVKTDMSGLDKGIKEVGRAVKDIPPAKFPDMSSNFKLMEKKIADLQKKLSQRVHVFEIERDPQNGDLVKRIVVRTK